ncbi:helix-turn-helix transcriptional regulator [Citrobacter koseri]|uniref:helix-turn-helix transcriptional regulator n=1 Tax=Citrobacter TaxID=544 RepID=UPI002576A14A|nr:helix-turn-helix transcriptional regulator [Citrobacter sp. CK198]MDM2973289.1 helix-turn-helix transcriptional regulator [Citrobacter sp. CK198]HCC5759622.1 helix-turn-helix transcriptional regulator [Citrobacter koseri]
MKKETFADRLNQAMKEAGYSQASLGEAVGMSQPSVWKLSSGKTQNTRKLFEIARVLGVSPDWLANGDGLMRIEGQQPIAPTISAERNIFRIEVLDFTVSAGDGAINNEFVEVLHSVEYPIEEARHMFNGRKQEQIRIINVRGDSMSGTIEPGDLLFVDISIQHFDGDGIYAFLYDGTAHVKRLQKMKNKLLVISDNKTYAPWEPIEREEMNQLYVFGKIIGSMPQTYRKHG